MQLNFVSLSKLSSTRTGGEVLLFETDSLKPIKEFILKRKSDDKTLYEEMRPHIIGDCTNIIPKHGVYLRPALRYIKRSIAIVPGTEKEDSVTVDVEAGTKISECVDFAVHHNCLDFLALSGIPGTAGSLPVQNVGAYGVESSNFIVAVFTINLSTATEKIFSNNECQFGYRNSIFKQKKDLLIYKVRLRLKRGAHLLLKNRDENIRKMSVEENSSDRIRSYILGIRRAKGTLLLKEDRETWGVGSFFVNPIIRKKHPVLRQIAEEKVFRIGADMVKIPAAVLIEMSGFKRGEKFESLGVSISRYHILCLVNNRNGTAEDFIVASRIINDAVLHKFGIKLTIEPTLHNRLTD